MGSFDSGFRMGQNAYQQNIDNDRQKVLDGYKADEMARQKITWGREDRERADVDAAFANVQNVRSGVSPEQQGQIAQTYGMTPAQTARAGPGLKAKLASYDAPDSYDLQTAPAEGAAPAFNAQGLTLGKPSDADLERASESVYLAKRDLAGVAQSKERQRGYGIREIADATAKMPLAEIETQLKQLNNNSSEYPFLYLRQGKGGYTFMSKEADGTPGKEFTMNESQVRQMAQAHALGAAGYGAESMAALGAAHKDVFDHVTKWNDVTAKTATNNNTAAAHANADDVATQRTGIMRDTQKVQGRTADRQEHPLSTKIKDLEGAMGRPLSEHEKLSYAGLGKEESALFKGRVALIQEAVKSGSMTQEVADAKMTVMYNEPKKAVAESGYVKGIAQAHKGGKLPEALAELKRRGFSAEQIAGFQREAGVEVANPMAEDPSALPPRKSRGLTTPGRQITTLVPPRSAADMRPVAASAAPQSPEEDFVRYMGNAPR